MISIKKISHTLSGNLLEFAAGFGITTFVTLNYTTEAAGKWMWIMAIAAIQAKIREGITQTALVKFACNGALHQQFSHRKLNFLVTLTIEISVFILLHIISYWQKGVFLEWYIAYGIYSLSTAIFRWQMFLWQGTLQTQDYLKAQSLAVSLTLFSTFLCYYYQFDLIALTFAIGFSKFIALLPFINYSEKVKVLKAKVSHTHIESIRPYAGFGLLRETTGSVAARAEMLLGGLLLTFSEVAWVGLAARYIQLLLLPNGAIQSLVNAKAHELAVIDKPNMKKLLGSALVGLWLIFGFGIVFFMFTSPYWIAQIHGEQYREALPIITILLIHTALFAPIGGVFGTLAHALNQPILTAKVVMVSSLARISLTVAAMWFWGLWGGIFVPFLVEIWGIYYTNKLMKSYLQTSWIEILRLGLEQRELLKLKFQKIR
ncbi:MAG: hypothetical protein AAGI07_04900 [Bacteroidota bacterium]